MKLKEMPKDGSSGHPLVHCGNERYVFSPGGQDLAVTTHDGRLLVWDAKVGGGGQLKHQFTPSSHLSASCSCLAWMPLQPVAKSPKSSSRKKRNSGGGSQRSDVIALGTTTGTLLLYSLRTGDVTSHLTNKTAPHRQRVNDLTWNSSGNELFTVSNDGRVGRIDVKKSTVVNTFPEDAAAAAARQPLHSICLHPTEQSLFVGSLSNVTWWDLDTKSILKTFAGGHVGNVSLLTTVNHRYVVSGGDNVQKDHSLTVWKMSLESSSCVKFSVNESIRTVVAETSGGNDDDDVTFVALGGSGTLHYFRQNLDDNNKKKSKPFKARNVLQIASERSGGGGHVGCLPILDVRFGGGGGGGDSLTVVYGSKTEPTFETLDVAKLEKFNCLVRKTSTSTTPARKESTNLVVPDTNSTLVLAPGPSMVERKRKADGGGGGGDVNPVSMVDRLRLLSRSDVSTTTTPPRTDSVIQLLLQGLHNRDARILSSVLDRADDDVIRNTVKKLPVEAVAPLLEELQHYVKGRGMVNQSHSRWLETTLRVHTAHLMSSPQCRDILAPIYATLSARTKHYSALLQLKGKLDVVTRRIAAEAKPPERGTDDAAEALLVYQDDSGDELSEAMDDLLLPHSDTDDNWMLDEEEESVAADEASENDTSDSDISLVEEVNGGDDDDGQEMDDDDDDDDKQ